MPIALVTGASKGIGRAIVDKLLELNWTVCGISRSNPQLDHPQFHWLEFDLMNFNDYNSLLSKLPEQLDLLVNNAGIAYIVAIENVVTLDIDKQFAVNTKAPILLTKTILTRLQQGKIINIASDVAAIPAAKYSIYAASKAALAMFGKCLYLETKIPVFNLLPTDVDTPMSHTILGPNADYSHLLKPGDIAKALIAVINGGHQPGVDIIVTNQYLEVKPEDLLIQSEVIQVEDL